MRGYFKEDDLLRIVPISTIFFFDIRIPVKEHDILLLVKGSFYRDTWILALLWAFLWATKCAHNFKKISVAYAVDAVRLSSLKDSWLSEKPTKQV